MLSLDTIDSVQNIFFKCMLFLGFVQYDVRDGKDPDASFPCYDECYEKNAHKDDVCNICGQKLNCIGARCTEPCVPFCWLLEPLVGGKTVLFAGLFPNGKKIWIYCKQSWQRIFHGTSSKGVLHHYSHFTG